MSHRYTYVGPAEIRVRAASAPAGHIVRTARDVVDWARAAGELLPRGGTRATTFVVDLAGKLRVAGRHSEHVACAGGQDVRAAGEMFFAVSPRGEASVEEVSNQSTGYCPEPASWLHVAAALDAAGIAHPGEFTTSLVFRKCPSCGQTNIVKDGWFVCAACGADLPVAWNFGR